MTDQPLVTVEQLQELLSHEAAFAKAFSFVVTAVTPGSCTIEVPHLPQFDRPGGIVSGVVYMTAADVAMWLAIKTLRGLGDPSVTSHMQTQFLRSARNAPRPPHDLRHGGVRFSNRRSPDAPYPHLCDTRLINDRIRCGE